LDILNLRRRRRRNESVIYETGLQYAVKAFVALTVLAFLAIVICGFIKTISTEMKNIRKCKEDMKETLSKMKLLKEKNFMIY